ncbi:MAG: hypothetical protein ABJG41_09930 [Cyclobacteriaceae bacterium]
MNKELELINYIIESESFSEVAVCKDTISGYFNFDSLHSSVMLEIAKRFTKDFRVSAEDQKLIIPRVNLT